MSREPVNVAEDVIAPSRSGAPVFVGRERELDALTEGLEAARAGVGRVFLLAGEPGIGKSRLADELGAQARERRVRVLWGRCWEAGGAPAYWPWVQSIRALLRSGDPERLRRGLGPGAGDVAQIVPEVRDLVPDVEEPPPLDPESSRFRLFDAVTRFLMAAAEPEGLVLVVDDLHAADAPSLLLLRFLAGEIAESHVMVVGCYRRAGTPPTAGPGRAMGGRGTDPRRPPRGHRRNAWTCPGSRWWRSRRCTTTSPRSA